MPHFVDPAVSRVKFNREISDYRTMEATYRKRGWLLLDAEFPEVFVAFAATKLRPAPLVAAVLINFSNYDLHPPSVRFADPFTREPLLARDLQFAMYRRSTVAGAEPNAVAPMIPQIQIQLLNMIQNHGPEEYPFICLPGIREYHDNPAHTGDSWLLHRASGEGSLAFILEKIWSYGVDPLSMFQVQVQVPIQLPGMMTVGHPQAFPE